MTALRGALEAALVLGAVVVVFRAAEAPESFATVAWIAAWFVTATAAAVALAALQPRKGDDDG